MHGTGGQQLKTQRNLDKLKARYPEGFDPERSLHREGTESEQGGMGEQQNG